MYTLLFQNEVQLLKNHFEPPPDYKFPKGAVNNRSFQYKWLLNFQPWLVYSKEANGGYCLPCVLFATSSTSYHGSDPGILVTRPLINFGKALELFGKHQCKEYDLLAITKVDAFVSVMEGQQPSISSHINQSIAKTIATNRLILKSIIKTIVLCGQQNISLCGNHDNLLNVEEDKDDILNHGNFLALE